MSTPAPRRRDLDRDEELAPEDGATRIRLRFLPDGGDEIEHALEEAPGTYFLADFPARTFEHTVERELGLDRWPELRDEYFRHYTRVMWLAQRPTEATRVCAQRAAERLELPLVERPVGNAGLERSLEALLAG